MNLINLLITESDDDLSIIKREKKALKKGIKLSSSTDIDKAVRLANYLFSLGYREEAGSVLDGFIYLINPVHDRQDLWSSNGQGIILRSYIAGLERDHKTRAKLIAILQKNDFVTDKCGRYDLYLEDIDDHEDNMIYALSESQKYKCEVIGQQALTFVYYYEMLPLYKETVPKGFEEKLKDIIDNCYTGLKLALNEK